MANENTDFGETALIGQQISIMLLAKLVDKGLISHGDAADILDGVLLQLENWQSLFPGYQQRFEAAREFLAELIAGYRAILRRPPD